MLLLHYLLGQDFVRLQECRKHSHDRGTAHVRIRKVGVDSDLEVPEMSYCDFLDFRSHVSAKNKCCHRVSFLST